MVPDARGPGLFSFPSFLHNRHNLSFWGSGGIISSHWSTTWLGYYRASIPKVWMDQQHPHPLQPGWKGRILGNPQTKSEPLTHYSWRSTVIKEPARCPCDENHLRHLLNTEPFLEVLVQWSRNGAKECVSNKYHMILIIMDVWKRLFGEKGGGQFICQSVGWIQNLKQLPASRLLGSPD